MCGVISFSTGVTDKTVEVDSRANANNTVVVLSCITTSDGVANTFLGYYFEATKLHIKTSSKAGDKVSYIVKYLF